jgi:hypothetical protein
MFGNPEQGENPPFETAARQRLEKTQQAEKTYVFSMCSSERQSVWIISRAIVTYSYDCKCSVNPFMG